MRLFTILLLILFISNTSQAGIGKITKTFNDASRNRNIETEIYYPAAASGDNVPALQGSYPLLVWGHGFVMSVSSYMNIVNAIVNDGYIVALPKTEGGITPNHQDFAKDLLFLVNQLTENENNLSSSLLYQRFNSLAAIGGHSMGGGCSILAGQLGNGNIHLKTIINFAAANTNPSAVDAAVGVTVPVLMFAGTNDCITTIAQHQQPIFNNVASSCKMLVAVKGGSHCYFADSSFTCSLGELTCSPSASISRATQHQRTFAVMKPWLDIYLKGAGESVVSSLKSILNNTNHYTVTDACSALSSTVIHQKFYEIINLSDNKYLIKNYTPQSLKYELFNSNGQIVMSGQMNSEMMLDATSLSAGVYFLNVQGPQTIKVERIVVR